LSLVTSQNLFTVYKRCSHYSEALIEQEVDDEGERIW